MKTASSQWASGQTDNTSSCQTNLMQFWNNIIQTAMLGTGKRQLTASDLPETLSIDPITGNTNIDKEEQFLQIASLAFNYRQSGIQPLQKEGINIPVAPPEDKPYCSPKAFMVIKDILEEDATVLLNLWLKLSAEKRQLIPPSLLPALLDKANSQKSLRTNVENCMGKRGEWLCGFNENWRFSVAESEEDKW